MVDPVIQESSECAGGSPSYLVVWGRFTGALRRLLGAGAAVPNHRQTASPIRPESHPRRPRSRKGSTVSEQDVSRRSGPGQGSMSRTSWVAAVLAAALAVALVALGMTA